MEVRGVGAWDPLPGDGEEHDAKASSATDGDLSTYWPTETYSSFSKPGVGLLLDAGRTVSLSRLTVSSDTPGFTATIQAGGDRTGPFHDVSGAQTVGTRTTFSLDDAKGRYFVVWITTVPPGGTAHVNEVDAS